MSQQAQAQDSDKDKYEFRVARPFAGWLGLVYYVWEGFAILFMGCMFVNVYNDGPLLPLGLSITSTLVGIAFWAATVFWFMPNYATKQVPSCDPNSTPHMILQKEERTYPSKVKADLSAHSDQAHFQSAVLRNLYIICFLGVFYGEAGLDSLQPIPFIFSAIDVMYFVTSKGLQLMIIGSYAYSFSRLCDTLPCFLWRHMTAMNKQYNPNGEKGGDLALGNQYGVRARNNNSLIGSSIPRK